MRAFLRAFCFGMAVGLPVAFGTWMLCTMSCNIEVNLGAQPLIAFRQF